jgi:hypothetical protein
MESLGQDPECPKADIKITNVQRTAVRENSHEPAPFHVRLAATYVGIDL